FALLATVEIDSLARGPSGVLDWFGILTFGVLALVVWVMWIDARVFGMSSRVAVLFQDTEIGFQPTFHLGRTLIAVFLTVLWIIFVCAAWLRNGRSVLT